MIIDGNALLHRSFHALPMSMTTKSGEVVNAVYGFAAFLLKAVRELKPEYVVLTMDPPGPTFRHKKFKAYKAQRVKAPQELYDQIPRIKELAQAFDIPTFSVAGFEADDLIGTIARLVDGEVKKIILTGDKDTLQLVNNHTEVYSMSRGVSESIDYDEKTVKAKTGLAPEQQIDYKALRGDPSDNIPGVPGIGEKTAVVLLGKFKTLDKVYEQVNKNSKQINEIVTPRIINLLSEHKKEAYLSQDLATIKCDVPIKFDLEKTRFSTFDEGKVIDFFADMEFKSLMPRLQTLFNTQANKKEVRQERADDKFERNRQDFRYTLVDQETKFKKFLAAVKKQKNFTFDTETTGIDPLTASLLGISFSWKKGEAWYVNFADRGSRIADRGQNNLFSYQKNSAHDTQHTTPAIHPWLAKLKPIFEDESIKKHAHNAKYDIRVMWNQGVDVKSVDFDTMIASYLLNPGTRQHNIDALAFSELGFEKINKTDLLGKGRDKKKFEEVEDEKLSLYSCEDADFTERLANRLAPKLKAAKLDTLFNTIEMPLVLVLARMEENGVKIDPEFLRLMSGKLAKKLKTLESKIHEQAGAKFNINSTQQLKVVLFDKLEIPTDNIAKTKTGISTAASELDKLKDYHPIIRLLQEYRELAKLASTYVDSLPALINKKTGRLHTSFNQTVAATGRLSSTEPNLQNIPIRTELGREIRRAFVADRGCVLVSLDYSQIELRLAAHMSGDKKMIAAFNNNADIHTSTAAEINQVSPEAVDKNMRREAKAINFGILYGQGPHGLSQTADIPYARAQEFIEQYFNVYKDIKNYIDKTVDDARRKGYTETLFGRRRPLPEIDSSVAMIRKAAERMAVNTPLQGTAADMIKAAMVEIADKVKDPDIRMILQVHDELVFEIKRGKEKDAVKKVKAIMENVIKLKVPVIVDVSIGRNWGEMKDMNF